MLIIVWGTIGGLSNKKRALRIAFAETAYEMPLISFHKPKNHP